MYDVLIYVFVYIQNLKNEAFRTAEHLVYGTVSIAAKWKKHQTVRCCCSKTAALGKKEKRAAWSYGD